MALEHIGSAHHDAELAVLKAAAPLRMAAGQLEFDFEPARKLDSVRVIEEARAGPVPYAVRAGESGALRRAVRGVVTTQAGARRARPG
jgi:hypothetical protein